MDIQWYPGHMTKAKRQMQEDMKLIDMIIELVDARVPLSSRNPDINELGKNKSRLILLNKSDLSDPKVNLAWREYFRSIGMGCLLVDSRKKSDLKNIPQLVTEACREKLERDARRGIKNRPIRAMVAGIPNVGKSTFINSYAGRACTKTGNRPGVTKGKQWIRMGKGLELLDTPGILWPKFDDPDVGKRLAMIGSVNDNILNIEELSLELIRFLQSSYPSALSERYTLGEEGQDAVKILEEIAQKRNCIVRGNEISYKKAADLLIDDFRSGKLGRISLESPEGE